MTTGGVVGCEVPHHGEHVHQTPPPARGLQLVQPRVLLWCLWWWNGWMFCCGGGGGGGMVGCFAVVVVE